MNSDSEHEKIPRLYINIAKTIIKIKNGDYF